MTHNKKCNTCCIEKNIKEFKTYKKNQEIKYRNICILCFKEERTKYKQKRMSDPIIGKRIREADAARYRSKYHNNEQYREIVKKKKRIRYWKNDEQREKEKYNKRLKTWQNRIKKAKMLGILDFLSVKKPDYNWDAHPPINWDLNVPFRQRLYFKAETYNPQSLFDVKSTEQRDPEDSIELGEAIVSPCGKWVYRERLLLKNKELTTCCGNKRGTVAFNGTVCIPIINKRTVYGWDIEPWMSLTPLEYFTLRPGIRYSHGKVIVAGLGLGYQLQRICQKKTVKEVILVEKDKDLVDWILPRIKKSLKGKLKKVIIEDACKVIPLMEADVAVIDIYKTYGYNKFPECPNIGKVWIWGSAEIGD